MNIWLQIKGEGFAKKDILVLENEKFYSKNNIIMTYLSSSLPDFSELTCNVIAGESIERAKIIEQKKISFPTKSSVISFFNRILFKFITSEVRIDITIINKGNGKLSITFSKGNSSYSFDINCDVQNNNEDNIDDIKHTNKELPQTIIIKNIDLFRDLLEPLYSSIDERDMYIEKWEKTISLIPNGSTLKEVFDNFKNDIDIWFNVLFSWGIKRDKCVRYNKNSYNSDFYDIIFSENDIKTSTYRVVTPYWSYIYNDGKYNKEILIKKGLLQIWEL